MANQKHLTILKQGVQIWNDWRENNPKIKPNLSGANLQKKDLQGINFSNTDIRGTNFAKANLRKANFQKAQAGLNKIGILVFCLWTLSISMVSFSSLLIISIGVTTRLPNVYSNISEFGDSILGKSIPYYQYIKNITNPLLTIIFITVSILLGIYGTVICTILIKITSVNKIFYLICFSNSIYFTYSLIKQGEIRIIILPIICSIIGILIGLCSINKGVSWIHRFFNWTNKYSINFVSSIGTNFMYSNLSEANFINAIIRNSNFSNSLIIHTNWYKSKYLHLSKLDKTILNNEKVLNLLLTRDGKNKTYNNCNLQGANLNSTNLSNANLELANINEAILENACLEGACLTKVQALNTNFTKANLTGACIEDWNINNKTNFDNVICEYIYLDKDKKQRSPSNNKVNFTSGEFANFHRQAFKTIELIFSQGIDWQSFLTSFSDEYNNFINNYNEVTNILKNQYEARILSKEEEIQEYKKEIKHLRHRIEILNKFNI